MMDLCCLPWFPLSLLCRDTWSLTAKRKGRNETPELFAKVFPAGEAALETLTSELCCGTCITSEKHHGEHLTTRCSSSCPGLEPVSACSDSHGQHLDHWTQQ